MKVALYFILFTSIVFSNDYFKRLKILEEKVSCQEQYNAKEKLKSSEKNLQEYLICIDSRIQYAEDRIINQKSIKVIQIFLTSNLEKAKKIVQQYNLDVKKSSLLKKSKAKFIERDIFDTTVLKDGKYYKVIIFQDKMDIKILLKNLHLIFKSNYLDAFVTELLIKEFQ